MGWLALTVIVSMLTMPITADADTPFPPVSGPMTLTVTTGGQTYTYPNGGPGPTISVSDGQELTITVSSATLNFSRLRARQCKQSAPVNNGMDFNPQVSNLCSAGTLGAGSPNAFVDSGPRAPGTTSVTITFKVGVGTAPDVVSAVDDELIPGFTCGPTGACKVVVNAEVTTVPATSNYLSFPLQFGTSCGAAGTNRISVGDASVVEGDGGVRKVKIPVTATNPSASEFRVDATVVSGTATYPGDLVKDPLKNGVPVTKPVVFSPGSSGQTPTTKFVVVGIASDTAAEANETFTVVLSNPTGGYTLGRSVGVGTVVDDDGPANTGQVASAAPAAICEGHDAPKLNKLPLSVSLRQASTAPVQVVLSVPTGTASNGGDYKPVTKPLAITFSPGQVQKHVTVSVVGDASREADETVSFGVSSPAGSVDPAIATGVILNDD